MVVKGTNIATLEKCIKVGLALIARGVLLQKYKGCVGHGIVDKRRDFIFGQ